MSLDSKDRNAASKCRENNSWHHIDQQSDAAIVFVHGYFSDASTCWLNKTGTFWPDLILTDHRIQPCSIYLAGYHTAIGSGDYGVSDCANEIIWALRRTGSDLSKPVLARQHIIFVCHSLGGIVIRYLLDAYREDFQSKKIGLCLIASPSIGSDYANKFGFLSELFKNRTGKQLQFFNPFLADLDERFMRFIESRETQSFIGAEAIEHHGPGSILTPWLKPIVTKISAGRYFAHRQTLAKTTHSSIAKPENIKHPSHNFLVDFLSRMPQQFKIQRIAGEPPLSTDTFSPTHALFDAYETRFEPFYLVRDLDRQILEQVNFRSIWLSGRSGTGKTCALKRYISHQSGRHLYLCLSQHRSPCNRDELLREFAETFSPDSTKVERSYIGIVSFFEGLPENNILVYVDEVDALSDAGHELLRLLGDLAITWKQRSQGRRLTFIVSSLHAPDLTRLANNQKLQEIFRFLNAPSWNGDELKALYEIISKYITELQLSPTDVELVINCANGSPRFLKTFLWDLKFSSSENLSIDIALARTSEQFGFSK